MHLLSSDVSFCGEINMIKQEEIGRWLGGSFVSQIYICSRDYNETGRPCTALTREIFYQPLCKWNREGLPVWGCNSVQGRFYHKSIQSVVTQLDLRFTSHCKFISLAVRRSEQREQNYLSMSW